MKKQDNKIIFEEQDATIIFKLKEIDRLMAETIKLKHKCEILKDSAYSEIQMFALDNNIDWNKMTFDSNENCVILKSSSKKHIGEVGDEFLKDLLGL